MYTFVGNGNGSDSFARDLSIATIVGLGLAFAVTAFSAGEYPSWLQGWLIGSGTPRHIAIGVLVDAFRHSMIGTGGERNLWLLGIAFLVVLTTPGFLVASAAGLLVRAQTNDKRPRPTTND